MSKRQQAHCATCGKYIARVNEYLARPVFLCWRCQGCIPARVIERKRIELRLARRT